jgi:nitrogen fixation protein FixH
VVRRILFLFSIAGLLALGQADWKIAVKPQADLKAQRPVPVNVTINDSKGKPVEGANVELVLTMVDMDHGETKFAAAQVKPGVYQAKPRFMMEGKWNIEVRAKKGSASASTKQQVEVEE